MNFKPLANRILVKRNAPPATTAGGIIIPETAVEKPQEGTVVAVGPGTHHKGDKKPVGVQPGDRILFGKWSGEDIEVEGANYLMIRDSDIIGKLI